jgi:hypothetical protein
VLINAAAPGTSFGSSDQVQFGFSEESDLTPYTKYLLEVGSGAKDASGNAFSGSAGISFLTEPAEPHFSNQISFASGVSAPVLATDPDGKVSLVWSTANGFAMKYWNGADQWVDETIPLVSTGAQVGALQA